MSISNSAASVKQIVVPGDGLIVMTSLACISAGARQNRVVAHVQWRCRQRGSKLLLYCLNSRFGRSLRIGSSRSIAVSTGGPGAGGGRGGAAGGKGASNASGVSNIHTYPARRAMYIQSATAK